MPSFGALKEEMASLSGSLPAATLVMRYLHTDGFFDRAAKSQDTPQIEVVHGVIAILALMAPKLQIEVSKAVRAYWNLRTRSFGDRVNALYSGPPPVPSSLPCGTISTLGAQLVGILGRFASFDANVREDIEATNIKLTVWRDVTQATIQTHNTYDLYIGDLEDHLERSRPPLSITAIAEKEVFQRIGALVRESRIEAARRGVSISTDKAYAALGLAVLPDPPYGSTPSSDMADFSGAAPKNLGAAEAPPPTTPKAFVKADALTRQPASTSNQDRDNDPVTLHSTDHMGERDISQPHSVSGPGCSRDLQRSNLHAFHSYPTYVHDGAAGCVYATGHNQPDAAVPFDPALARAA